MAASTITRDTWTNDSGTTSAPVGDGTILNNNVLQNNIYARIDAMFAGTGSYTTFELGGLFKADGFGTHSFSAGGTGIQNLSVRNTTAGTGNYAVVSIGNDADASLTLIRSLSSTYTPDSLNKASGTLLYANGAGGMSIAAGNAAGVVRFYSGGTTEQMRIDAAGGVMIGTTTTSGAHQLNVGAGNITCGYDGGTSAYTLISSLDYEVRTSAGVIQASMSSTGFLMATWPTTAAAVNAVVGDTDVLRRSTSILANKHSIESISATDAISAVSALRPVLYRSRVDDDQRQWPGFIAEEVAIAAPHLATYGPDGDLQSVAYDRVPAYLVAAVQALTARVSALEAA